MRSRAASLWLLDDCNGPRMCRRASPAELDVMEVMLPIPADQVKTAVADVLTRGGYEVDQDDDGNLTTGMRQEIRSPWNGLLRGDSG